MHSAILSTFIRLPFVIKTFVLSIFEWPLKTGFAVTLLFNARSGIESELLADLNLEYKMRYACFIFVPFLYGVILWFKEGQTLGTNYIYCVCILYIGLVMRKPDFDG